MPSWDGSRRPVILIPALSSFNLHQVFRVRNRTGKWVATEIANHFLRCLHLHSQPAIARARSHVTRQQTVFQTAEFSLVGFLDENVDCSREVDSGAKRRRKRGFVDDSAASRVDED